MALENADAIYPDQWNRLEDKDQKGWGRCIPTHGEMSGKSKEELLNWSNACRRKIAYWIGCIPNEGNDGFQEVRAWWLKKRADALADAAKRLEEDGHPATAFYRNQVPPQFKKEPAIRPMTISLGGWPGAQPVSYTNESARVYEEVMNGCGTTTRQEKNVTPTSPTATLSEIEEYVPKLSPALTLPFKRPRTTAALSEEGTEKDEELIPPRRSKRLRKKAVEKAFSDINSLECDEVLSDE